MLLHLLLLVEGEVMNFLDLLVLLMLFLGIGMNMVVHLLHLQGGEVALLLQKLLETVGWWIGCGISVL